MSTELQSPPALLGPTVDAVPRAPISDPSCFLPALEGLVRSRAIELHAKGLAPGKALLLIREEVLGVLRRGESDPVIVRMMLRRMVEVIFETYRPNR